MTVQTQTLAPGEEGDRRAAQMAAGGASLGQIAAAFFPPLSIEHARAAVARGRQQLADRSPKPSPMVRSVQQPSPPAPEAPAPDPVERLLAWAEADGPQRAATLAARTRSHLKELTDLREHDAATALQRKVVTALEKQLADARVELRRLTGRPVDAVPTTKQERDAIRAWARENGYTVGSAGSIPNAIIDAYRAAHRSGAKQ